LVKIIAIKQKKNNITTSSAAPLLRTGFVDLWIFGAVKKKVRRDALKGENNPMYGKPKPSGAGTPSQAIEVTDIKNNITTYYNSIREAGKALNIDESSIRYHLKSNNKKPC